MRVTKDSLDGSVFASLEDRMKTATRFQFWSPANAARTVLAVVAGVLLAVVTASMFEPPMPEPKESQGTERKTVPDSPVKHHRFDVLV